MKAQPTQKSKKKPFLHLQLFVSGMTPKSMEAIENIRKLCDNHIKNLYKLEIIDIYKNPEAAIKHHIIFCPSLIIVEPLPVRTLIGTLSDTAKVMKALGINY